jgi:hypothetical protein
LAVPWRYPEDNRVNRDLTILGRQRDGNGYQYNRSLKIIEKLQYMNNLDIVLALLTTPNHRFSRVDTTAAFQAATSATSNWVQENSSHPCIKPMSSTFKRTVLNSYD